MDLCEATSGLPCVDGGDLELPEGEAVIVGTMEPGSVMKYTDPDGQAYEHPFTDYHQVVAIQDSEGNTALVVISDTLEYTERGIQA